MRLKQVNLDKQQQCQICGKGDSVAYNRPNSLHKTKRVVKPNLQQYNGMLICTRCLKNQ